MDDSVVAAFRLPIPASLLMEIAQVLLAAYGDELVMQVKDGFLTIQRGQFEEAQTLP